MKFLTIAISAIHYFWENNVSRQVGSFFASDADLVDLSTKMYDGWNTVLGVPSAYKLTKEQVDQAVAQREKQREVIANDKDRELTFTIMDTKITVNASEILRVFDMMYMSNGKVIRPTHGGVWGYRRNAALLYANTVRFKKGEKTLITDLAIEEKHYDKLADTFEDCVRENTGKVDGVKALNWKDIATSGKALYEAGKNENKFRQIYKVGTAQKLFAFCKLNHTHRDLNLFDLVMRDEIEITSMDKEELAKAIKESWPSEAVLDYMKNPKRDRGVPVKAATKSDTEALIDQSPIDIVAYVLFCHQNNKLGELAKLNAHASVINAATRGLFVKPVKVEKTDDKKVSEVEKLAMAHTTK